MSENNQNEALFWRSAEPLLRSGAAERGTMMGFPCLRVNGQFFASLERTTGHLIVKLPAERVSELIDQGDGLPFSPNGRVFREWVTLPDANADSWPERLEEARTFVMGQA